MKCIARASHRGHYPIVVSLEVKSLNELSVFHFTYTIEAMQNTSINQNADAQVANVISIYANSHDL